MPKFFLVKAPRWTFWMKEFTSEYWINISGGRCPIHHTYKILKTMIAYDWEDLDWSLVWPASMEDTDWCGWLTPGGRWHPCEYHQHDQVAFYLFGKDPCELEKTHVRVNGLGERVSWIKDGFLTAEQRNWLSLNGYNIKE